jgi:hypothetical protein
MILKGSQRGGARQLAVHLLKQEEGENEHVAIGEVRGFVASDVYGAMAEAQALARGTRCSQPIFSMSMNPPKDAEVSRQEFVATADRAEEALGLEGRKRVIVFHEKEGRLHAHVVWSRIDEETMKAVNLPHFKNKLRSLSKELFLEHGWELPEGHRIDGWKNPLNFTLAEFQQAKEAGLDPRELKQLFRSAYDRSDSLAGFRHALEEHGYYLARGDRRGIVALSLQGEVFAVGRWTGVKAKDITQKLGDGENLPGVAAVRKDLKGKLDARMRAHIKSIKDAHDQELTPLQDELRMVVESQRHDRTAFKEAQEERSKAEAKERADRFRKGLGVVMDILTGRLFKLRRQNEQEAKAGRQRDRRDREALVRAQLTERKPLHQELKKVRERQRRERAELAQRIAGVLRQTRQTSRTHEQSKSQPTLKRRMQ